MRRLFLAATLGILGAVVGRAALNLGAPGAVKSRVKNLDGKVQAQAAQAALISGTAASGHAIASQTFTIGDCTGKTQTGTTGADGSFSITTTLSFPIFLKVGASPSFYSVAYGAGTANIHPFTDLTLRSFYRSSRGITNLDTSFAGSGNFAVFCGAPPASALTSFESLLMNTLSPVAARNSVNPITFNPFTTTFSADGTGFDAILDQTHIVATVNYSTITITDTVTTVVLSTITPVLSDVVTPATPTGLTATSITSTTATLQWTASVSTNVAGYGIYRGGVLIANTPGTTYTDASLAARITYSYTVDAFSWLNKRSAATAAYQVLTPAPAVAGSQTFTANGSFTVPVGITSVTVQVWGAGGQAGGGCEPHAGTLGNGGGGGAGGGGGGYSAATLSVTPGQVFTVTVGTGSTGDSTHVDGKGADGASSSFGSLIAQGGGGGGGAGSVCGGSNPAGIGGTASGGTTNISGRDGTAGSENATFTTDAGINTGGTGGAAGGAAGGVGGSGATFGGGPGNNGVVPGGGGGGDGGTVSGGVGESAAGRVIVSWQTDYTGVWNIGHYLSSTTGGCVGDTDPSLNNAKNGGTVTVDSLGNFHTASGHLLTGTMNLIDGTWSLSGTAGGCQDATSQTLSASGTCNGTFCSGTFSSTSTPTGGVGTESGPFVWWRPASYAGVWVESSTVTAVTAPCLSSGGSRGTGDIGSTSMATFIINGSGGFSFGDVSGSMNMSNGSWSASSPGTSNACPGDTVEGFVGSGGSCPAAGPCAGTALSTSLPSGGTDSNVISFTR